MFVFTFLLQIKTHYALWLSNRFYPIIPMLLLSILRLLPLPLLIFFLPFLLLPYQPRPTHITCTLIRTTPILPILLTFHTLPTSLTPFERFANNRYTSSSAPSTERSDVRRHDRALTYCRELPYYPCVPPVTLVSLNI